MDHLHVTWQAVVLILSFVFVIPFSLVILRSSIVDYPPSPTDAEACRFVIECDLVVVAIAILSRVIMSAKRRRLAVVRQAALGIGCFVASGFLATAIVVNLPDWLGHFLICVPLALWGYGLLWSARAMKSDSTS